MENFKERWQMSKTFSFRTCCFPPRFLTEITSQTTVSCDSFLSLMWWSGSNWIELDLVSWSIVFVCLGFSYFLLSWFSLCSAFGILSLFLVFCFSFQSSVSDSGGFLFLVISSSAFGYSDVKPRTCRRTLWWCEPKTRNFPIHTWTVGVRETFPGDEPGFIHTCLLVIAHLLLLYSPTLLKLLHPRQRLIPDPEGALHLFLVQNTLSWEPLQSSWRSRLEDANRTTSSATSRDVTPRFPNQTPSSPRLHLQILSMRTGDEGQPWRSPEPLWTQKQGLDNLQKWLRYPTSDKRKITYRRVFYGRFVSQW